MTSIDKFEDHCWKDVIPDADIKLYAGWRRETFVGPRPALLAIDLYDLVYRDRRGRRASRRPANGPGGGIDV
jgi:maleamate amidohydrolase